MTTTTPRTATPSTNGKAPPRIAGAREKRVPWVALGVVLVIAGALVFGLMVQSAGDRTAVVVAAREIAPGKVIEATDLRVVDAAIDGPAATISSGRRGELIGRVATSRVPAGAMLSEGQFAEGARLPAGSVVVGALLGPGGLPVPNLRVGDKVTLLEARDGERSSPSEPLGSATVYLTTRGSQTGTQFVSLVVDEAIAQRVTDAAATQLLRLVLRPGEGG